MKKKFNKILLKNLRWWQERKAHMTWDCRHFLFQYL